MAKQLKSFIFWTCCLLSYNYYAQTLPVDHWETVIYADETWNYFIGVSQPPADWRTFDFDDSGWEQGPGGIGYGDDDDNTVINPAISLFLRILFTIVDTSKIAEAILHIDYDDAFVAYINDVEIARSAGLTDEYPAYNQLSTTQHEAEMPMGGMPSAFSLRKQLLTACLHQGENVLAIQVHNASTESSDMSSTTFFSVGITDASVTYKPLPTWFTEPFSFSSSNLPIIIITTENGASIPDEPKIKAHMGIIDNGPGERNSVDDMYNEYDGIIGIETRGNVAQSFPKKSYAVETRDETGNNLNVPLLGMPAENDWILNAMYIDKTFLRNPLASKMSQMLGRYASRTRFCELVLNGNYEGIYVFMEKIKPDNDRLDISQMDSSCIAGDSLTGGYIYEIAQAGEEFGLRRRFKYPKADEIMPQQREYIRNYDDDFREVMEDADYDDPVTGYAAWIDADAFIDEIIVQEACKNSDAYGWSSYFYKDRLGKLCAGPVWDFDQALSNSTFNDGPNYSEFVIEKSAWDSHLRDNHPPFWRKLFAESNFKCRFCQRWFALRAGPFRTDSLMALIDNWAEQLAEAQERNFTRWPILGVEIWRSTPGYASRDTYQKEVDYMKQWLANRLVWMDNELSPWKDCMITGTGSINHTENAGEAYQFRISPNPFQFATAFQYRLAEARNVTIKVYNLLGQEVKSLVSSRQGSGHYRIVWNGLDNNNHRIASGVYFYIFRINGKVVFKTKLIKY